MTDLNNDHWKELTRAAQAVRLSAAEKDALKQELSGYLAAHPPRLPTFTFWKHFAQYGTVAALVLTLSTAGAAETSLPGDLLYGIKVNLNEKVVSALAPAGKARANVEVALTTRRLEEAEEIITKNEVDSPEQERSVTELTERLSRHVQAVQTEIDKIKDEDLAGALKIGSDLEVTLSSHGEALALLDEGPDAEVTRRPTTATIRQTIERETATAELRQEDLKKDLLARADASAEELAAEQIEEISDHLTEVNKLINTASSTSDDSATIAQAREKVAAAQELLDEAISQAAAGQTPDALESTEASAKTAASVKSFLNLKLNSKPEPKPSATSTVATSTATSTAPVATSTPPLELVEIEAEEN
jgi:hypothetical protein